MGMRGNVRADRFVTLQTCLIGVHLRSQLCVARPFLQARLIEIGRMHFMTSDARKISAAKTRRGLEPVELTARYSDHSIAPKTVPEKIGFCFTNEIFLLAMIRRAGLNDKALFEFALARAKSSTVTIEIDFVGHVVESPDAVALPAIKSGDRAGQT